MFNKLKYILNWKYIFYALVALLIILSYVCFLIFNVDFIFVYETIKLFMSNISGIKLTYLDSESLFFVEKGNFLEYINFNEGENNLQPVPENQGGNPPNGNRGMWVGGRDYTATYRGYLENSAKQRLAFMVEPLVNYRAVNALIKQHRELVPDNLDIDVKKQLFESRFEQYEKIDGDLNALNRPREKIAQYNSKTAKIYEIAIKATEEEIKKL